MLFTCLYTKRTLRKSSGRSILVRKLALNLLVAMDKDQLKSNKHPYHVQTYGLM